MFRVQKKKKRKRKSQILHPTKWSALLKVDNKFNCLLNFSLFVCFRHGYGDYAAQAAAAAVSSAATVDPYAVDGRFVLVFDSR